MSSGSSLSSTKTEMSKSPISSLINTSKLIHDKYGFFVQKETGRRIKLHGINLDSTSKQPYNPCTTTYLSPDDCGFYSNADNVSFVGRPFPLKDAASHFRRIKLLGFNTIRYVVTWEAIEHEGPGIYDLDFINYTIEILKIIHDVGGLYVFIDPHQDVWSRFTGGSGAPFWTLHAAGLNPERFSSTQSALIHNCYPDPADYPKMVWASNYNRLATQIMFTMFFSGKMFFPKCIIDGVNIQDYLQYHFFDAFGYLMSSLKSALPGLFNTMILGIESMNEPKMGLYGLKNLDEFPKEENLKVYTTPTAFQGMKLGMGIPQEVDMFKISIIGPRKVGSKYIDPDGDITWAESDDNQDSHYGFQRSPNWKLGNCILAEHGIWDVSKEVLLKPDYFRYDPTTGRELDITTFLNENFLDYWKSFKKKMRSIDSEMYLVLQPPVFEKLPTIKDDIELIDNRVIVAQHYYDGMSLMFKTWNRKYNVDTVGIVRGKYINPVFGLVFGEANIRRSFRDQFRELKRETSEAVGSSVPCIFTETGMPYDMDDKKAYSDGDYSSQESANDALMYALESSVTDFTYWCYNSDNNHEWGDNWNLEDFSIHSKDDAEGYIEKDARKYLLSSSRYGEVSLKSDPSSQKTFNPKINSIESTRPIFDDDDKLADSFDDDDWKNLGDSISEEFELELKVNQLLNGVRVRRAIQRPYPVLTNGIISFCEFDLKTTKFELTIDTSVHGVTNSSEPTLIYLPELHFPMGSFTVETTSGITKYTHNRLFQVLEWYHDSDIGEISLTVINEGQNEAVAASAASMNSSPSSSNDSFFKMCLKLFACEHLC